MRLAISQYQYMLKRTMRSFYTILADNSAIARPQLDDRQYRFFKIDTNGLHVLVILDPSADKSGAALDVHVGATADKQYGIAGLAHFCEHLLFMGTKKYPKENEYQLYLSNHSGHANAYTLPEHTNYYFEVALDYLEGALDRFLQFFIAPLFLKLCQDREIQAVDLENKKNLQLDGRRFWELQKATGNPDHPLNGFSTGNYQTLHEEPVSRGVNPRDVLLQYYQDHYLGNIMLLVVLGNQLLDQLTSWSLSKFGPVPLLGLDKPHYNVPVFLPEHQQKLIRARPIMDTNLLLLRFTFPDRSEETWLSKPEQYFSHLLGHESKGSICYYLKQKNWLNELSCGLLKLCEGTHSVDILLELTPEGLAHWQEAVVHVYEYLAMVAQEGPQQWVWKEISDMLKMNFRFASKKGTALTVSRMARDLWMNKDGSYIPYEHLLDSSILRDWDPAEISRFGDNLTPANMRIMLVSPDFKDLPLREKWYGTEYAYDAILPELLLELSLVDPRRNPELHLPHPNAFIPSDFTVFGEKAEHPLSHPYLLHDSPKLQLWYKKDDRFRMPKGVIGLYIHTPPVIKSVNSAVKGLLLAELIEDELNDLKYYADIVGLSCTVSQVKDVISVKILGYNDKLPRFLLQVVGFITGFVPKPDRFDSIKYKLTQDLRNLAFRMPYYQILEQFSIFTNEKTYLDEHLLAALDSVTFDETRDFAANELWSDGVLVRALVHGNFEYETARTIEEQLLADFKLIKAISDTNSDALRRIQYRSHGVLPNEHIRTEHTLADPGEINSALFDYFQISELKNDPESQKLKVLTHLLATVLKEPCFSQLRTKEQLGYVVFSGYKPTKTHFGLRVLVQSERPCAYLQYRTDEFFKIVRTTVLGDLFTEEKFQSYKQSLKDTNLQTLKNLREELSRFMMHIWDTFYNFNEKEEDVAVLEGITKEELLAFFDEYFGPHGKAGRISYFLNSQSTPEIPAQKRYVSAVHNYIYEHHIDVATEDVDKHIEETGEDPAALALALAISDEGGFVRYVSERSASPTPESYPLGQLISGDEFQKTHPLGPFPLPRKPLTEFYLRDGSHL